MLKCSHKFHFGCLKNLIGEKDWAKCPVCSTIFGIMTGDQPDGTMDVSYQKIAEIPGHGKGAIVINYHMKGGSRNGKHFSGTSRTAYLPDNKEGQEVLELFREAFNRKLIFTVGRSVTTGLDNQTVWNGIHHKTSTNGGVASFGYPDPTYLTRVKE
jgi:deltex-like protein